MLNLHRYLRREEEAAKREEAIERVLASRPTADEVQNALDWVEGHLSIEIAEAIAANVPARDASAIGRMVLDVIDAYRTAQERDR